MNDQAVAQHYSRGGLEQQVLDVLTTIGADLEHLDSDQLASVDEFHIGGRSATVELVNQLNLRPGLRVLDVGRGVGGYCPLSDVMRVGPGDLTFPVPWAATSATNFVAEPAYYRELLAKAGLTVQYQSDRRNFALDFFREMKVRTAQSGRPCSVCTLSSAQTHR